MICPNCGYETNSEKIFYIHTGSCIQVREENGLNNVDTKPEEMSFNQLKKYASEKGIDTRKKNKEAILKELEDMEVNPNGNNNSTESEDNPPVT